MPETMKAALLYGDEDIRYEDVEVPEVKTGMVKVRVRACGICGSDVPRVFNKGAFYYPIILGHEFSGEVVEVADDVTSVKVGDCVVGAPLVPCMKCDDCLRGDYASCKKYSFMGSKQSGAFCDYVVMLAVHAVKFDKNEISFQQAAMFEPATVAIHGMFCANYQGGGQLAILGGGTIGLFALQWAKILGAERVTVFDINDERLEFLKGYGADHTINTTREGFMEEAMGLTGGRGYDYVFETAGQEATMKIAFHIAATKSSVCFIGTPHKDVTFDPVTWELMNRKEFHLTGSWMSYSAPFPGREWPAVAHFLQQKKLRINDDLIYKTYPMSQAQEAFMNFKSGPVAGKILLLNED